ncbi:hypothetical protein AGABI1DRAFT_75265 [Agaricus bisporus var. burnettii JB137-S8]|uniref:G domain-containing protein n=1 Tax=Agaricus bisporus var. burnettii (strain JB137-S8 / ATCC MYA-4627 / FGSC 10392) TaxID=597362 RepID=K5WTM3_AGABU|nr:uncharacterized protein AGABI1DRAFT_75265 [Agaricus bisporus var. burnettii JB137-S8]EKM78776.1 hypothetical protein AGABI1DRAFT_75265 [Agaricus bisporus var. burnettii JB137-S8]
MFLVIFDCQTSSTSPVLRAAPAGSLPFVKPRKATQTNFARKISLLRASIPSTTFSLFAETRVRVMGPTGVGKSNFIDVLTGQIGKRSGHLLESYTTDLRASLVKDYNGTGANLVMVDTPGFDDTNKPDTEILSIISNWLEKSYRKKIKLAGVLYLHRITDNRMGGTPLKNLHMFGKLCGNAAMSRVTLVTTMWDQVQDRRIAQDHELELKENFWKPMLVLGSKMVRFENSLKSAKEIVDGIVAEKGEREILLLQEELVDLKKRLYETHAGRMLYETLQKLLDEQKASIDKLMEQIQNEGNPQLIEKLRKERLKIENDLQSALQGIQELRVPLSRKFLLFLFGKRGKIVSLFHLCLKNCKI